VKPRLLDLFCGAGGATTDRVTAADLAARRRTPHDYDDDATADFLGDTRCRWCAQRSSHWVHHGGQP